MKVSEEAELLRGIGIYNACGIYKREKCWMAYYGYENGSRLERWYVATPEGKRTKPGVLRDRSAAIEFVVKHSRIPQEKFRKSPLGDTAWLPCAVVEKLVAEAQAGAVKA